MIRILFSSCDKENLTLWLAGKVLDALDGEDEIGIEAIEVAKRELEKYSFLLLHGYRLHPSNFTPRLAAKMACLFLEVKIVFQPVRSPIGD